MWGSTRVYSGPNFIPDIHKLNLLSFADDTTLYQSGDNYVTLVQNLNSEINSTFKWLCANDEVYDI